MLDILPPPPDIVVTAVVRASLHHDRYPLSVAGWLQRYWHALDHRTVATLRRDIREHLAGQRAGETAGAWRRVLDLPPSERETLQPQPAPACFAELSCLYALGRQTYVVADVTAWLREAWPALPENARERVRAAVRRALSQDGAGDPRIDAPQWQALLAPSVAPDPLQAWRATERKP